MLLKPGYSLTWAYSLTAETMMKIKQTTQKIVSLLIMVSLAMSVGVSAAPARNESRLITDEAGYLVCQRCGPDHKDIYLMAEYPAGSREKSVNYHLVRDMSRYTFLMSSDAPALNSIVFDDDNSALSSAEHITVTEAGGKTRLNVIWANGKRNIFILDNP